MEQPASHDPQMPAIDPTGTSLFLDFDGTLVDLADRPDDVTVSSDLEELLERLARRLDRRLALVSGRSIAQLTRFFGPFSANVAMVGSHGAEILVPGEQIVSTSSPQALHDAGQRFTEAFAGNDRVLIEVKTLGVAIHYRLDPSAKEAALLLATEFAAEHGLELQRGKMMVEVRTAGHHKGSGIAALMRMTPFKGSVPVFVGDDLTDEPGFRHCAEMGGIGVLVGDFRTTAAHYRLPDVAAVHAWLTSL